jgi:hypothetical protein
VPAIRNRSGSDIEFITKDAEGVVHSFHLYAGDILRGITWTALRKIPSDYFENGTLEIVSDPKPKPFIDKVVWKVEGF